MVTALYISFTFGTKCRLSIWKAQSKHACYLHGKFCWAKICQQFAFCLMSALLLSLDQACLCPAYRLICMLLLHWEAIRLLFCLYSSVLLFPFFSFASFAGHAYMMMAGQTDCKTCGVWPEFVFWCVIVLSPAAHSTGNVGTDWFFILCYLSTWRCFELWSQCELHKMVV